MEKRLLVVDDDRLVLATLGRGLRAEGYTVMTAADGQAALAASADNEFDLAVLDIRLPDMSGMDLARRLREERGIQSLFLSAYGEKDLVAAASAEGGLGYVIKPVDVSNLVPSLETAMSRARDLRGLAAARTQLQQALGSGRVTSTAVGILMERFALGRDAAFQRLRAEARSTGSKIEKLADDLVNATELLNRLGGGDDQAANRRSARRGR